MHAIKLKILFAKNTSSVHCKMEYGIYANDFNDIIRVGVKYSTCTWYLYLSTYLSVLDVLEYLVYGDVKVLVLVLGLDKKVLDTHK